MAELLTEKPTRIMGLEQGQGVVIATDGTVHRAQVGMELQPGERLLVARMEGVELSESGTPDAPISPLVTLGDTGGSDPRLEALQRAILDGVDPTRAFEASAAGAGDAVAGGVIGSSPGGFVLVERNNDATLAEAGFDTAHGEGAPLERQESAGAVDAFAAITIREPQTVDNIINGAEATGVVIRGTVDDVEVGQPVTVTLTDQAGNALTVTTVVLPGLVWEANFGDLTGRLVDGPLTIAAETRDASGNPASDLGQTLLDTITTITLDLSDESDTGASQTDGLTRDNTPLLQGKGEPGATVTLSQGGNVLTVLTVDGAGNWQYQLPNTLADGNHTFEVNAVDIAGNRASDTLTVTVDTRAGIDIDDLDTGLILGQGGVTLSGATTEVEAGQSVTITLIGQSGETLLSGSALVGSDGRWQLAGLDLSGIAGPYEVRAEVTDLAGNRVIDGAPLIGQSDTLTLSEAELAKGPVSATGSLHTGAGQDGNLQVGFAADQSALEGLGLGSHGSPLSYQTSGQSLTASAAGVTVFTLTLTNDGSYRIVWSQSLDHGQDNLSLPFNLEYRDGDGDLVRATLNVNLVDSTPPDFTLPSITLTEDAFTDAGAVVGQSHFVIGHQADPLLADSVIFTNQGDTLTRLNGSGISSDGHALTFEFSGDRLLTGYYLNANGKRVEVLKAELGASQSGSDVDGTVTVTLNGPLDHQGGDQLSLGLSVSANEIDGDETRADLVVTINDGINPILGIDSGVTLQEGAAGQSLEGQLPVTVGSDRLVSLNFEASQPGLDGLTSGGRPTTYQVNGNVITLLDAGGKVILTVTLDLDGKYHVQLDGVLDQPVGTNSVNLGLQVQGRDFDGDRSNLGTLNIQITDGALPQVDPVSLTLTEDSDWSAAQSLAGELTITAGSDPLASITFDASQPGLQGLTSGQQSVAITVADHLIEGRTPDGQLVFTLTLGNDGKYGFTLYQPLDQGSADSLLSAAFTLTDSDGDRVSSSLSVAIGDGANPVISAVAGTGMTEANQGAGAVVSTMSFTVSHGADALARDSLKFDISAIQQSLDGKYSSHGSPVTFTLDGNGDLVGTSADGREVLRAELDLVESNGNWSVTSKVTLSGELDHQGSESLDLPLVVTLTDKDGDRASTRLPLVIKDGSAPTFVAGSGVSLDEGNLDGHNPLTGTGQFQISAGSDRVSEVSFADPAEQPALTALGQPVKYELVEGDPAIPGSQILKGYVEVAGQRIEVLQVELVGKLDNAANNGFDYKVTLFEGVHQSGGNATELPFKVNVVDSDKGSGNNDSTTGTLNVSIGEGDKPTLMLTGVTLEEGRFDGVNSSADDQQDTGKITIKADSDPVTDVRLTLSGQVLDADGNPVTHNGQTLTWQEVPGSNGHAFQAVTAGGTLVLSVTLPSVPGRIEAHSEAILDYRVTVHTNLDHKASDTLNLTLPVQATDSDGSQRQGTATIMVTDGENPFVSAIEPVRVEESDLDASSTQHPGTTPTEGGETAGGRVTISAGSDRVASLQLDVAAFNQANHLTSGGKAVTLVAHSNPGWYLAMAEGGKPVFWIHLDASGSYSVYLVGQLDHGAQGKDELAIEVPLFVTDHDGDRSPNVSVRVTVQDDMPVGTHLTHSLSETGSAVSGDLLPPANEGADGARVASVTVNGQMHAINGSLTLEVMSPDGKQVMGSLTIGADGNYSFTPRAGVDHDASTLSQVITAQLVDGDGDTAQSTLTLNLQDEAVRFTVNPVTGQEDQGAQDPSQGIPIQMALDIGDFDRGEHVDELLIQAPANAHGTFYYNGVALTTTADGQWFIVPPEAMVTGDKVHYTTTGLTFVPDANWSSWSNSGQPLHFQVALQVGVTQGTAPDPVTGDLAITVRGIADKPVWVTGSTSLHDSTDEDSSGIRLNVKASLTDTDRSESLSYQIKWEAGKGTLMLNGAELKPNASGIYSVSASNINKVTVVPGKDYSGDIKLSVTPVSTEKAPVVSGQNKAFGDAIEVVINVKPLADDAKLTVREIQGKEDTLLNLGNKIVLGHLGDTSDGSEQLFVRISGLPTGATLLLGGVAVTLDANGYYEVPYDRINDLKLQPPKNSNVDFDLTIKGVVKDSATLTDANGQIHTLVNEKETGSQTLHVDLVGVVDKPHVDLHSTGWAQEGDGYTITIKEDGRAPLDFRLESGEKVDTPQDTSESLNLVLEGLPAGARVFDGSGKELTLTFAGLDGQGNPLYQVNVSSLGNLQILPPPNSTADIHLVGHLVVTENDGDHQRFDVPLTIKVEPEIDAGDYAKTSHGLEDQLTLLEWRPDLGDSAERVTHLSLSGIEPGYEIWIRAGGVDTQLTVNGGAVDLSDADLQNLLNGGQLLVKAPEDSDRDTRIQSHVTITQQDVDSSATAQKVIEGSLLVDIRAVVEPEGQLVQTGQLDSQDGHDIPLKDMFTFEDLDPGSSEVIDYLVISDLPPGFVVVGGISDGKGNWTVPNSALGSYALHAPDGFTGTVAFKVNARVIDLGDNGEGDISAPVYRELNTSAEFHAANNGSQVAATVDLDNSQPITGVEDHSVDVGAQLRQMVTLGSSDNGDDELSIVITGLPAGVSVQGLTFDFVNGEYLIKLPNGLSDLDSLTLTLPEDYAGDGLHFTVRLVNTDTVSGDTKMVENEITLSITPEVDIHSGHDGAPSLQLAVKDVNGDGQPDNLEDTEIHLDLSVKLADISPSVTNGGLETVERVTVTADARYGHFLDGNGHPVQSLVVDANGLKDVVFVPKEHFSGQVPLAVTVDILDTATTGTDRGSWSGQVNFEVIPVNDPATLTVHDVTGNEDGSVSLAGFDAALVDNDGSEQIVALQIKGVPDGFTLSAPAVNNGGGVWQVPVGTDFAKLTLIPPADFSGSVNLTLSAFTLDKGLTLPLETSDSFTVTVNPVGDPIVADIQDRASGTEGEVITLNLGLETRDTQATGGSAGNVHENGPEQVRVTLEGVPDGAEVRLPNGVAGTVVDLGGGVWQITTDGGRLDTVELVTNDANGAVDLKVTAQSLDNGALGPEVGGSIHLDISPVNDAPVNVLPSDPQVAQEDTPFVIRGLQVTDVDAGNSPIEVRLSVEHGTLNLPAGSGVSVVGNGTGSLVLTGTLASLNALLSGGVTYQGVQDFNGQDALTMVTDDLGNTGSGGPLSDSDVLPIEVQAVNDAPVNQVPASLTVQEDGALSLSGISVKDVDAGQHPVSMTLSVSHGTLVLSGSAGSVSASGSGSPQLVLTGTLGEINLLLASAVHYQPDAHFWGSDTLHVTTSDLGNSGAGGVMTDSDTLPVHVLAQPDMPTLLVESGDIVTLVGTAVPLGISADVVNPAPGELSLRLSGLDGAHIVDEHGNVIGSDLGLGNWLLPVDHHQPLFVSGLAEGVHHLTVSAESSVGGTLLASPPESIDIHAHASGPLLGSGAAESLTGSDGHDVLRGGAGNDILTGGKGSDLFLWGAGDEGGNTPAHDIITDFNPGEGDAIDLSELLKGASDHSVDGLINHLQLAVSDGSNGLKTLDLAVSPAGDGKVSQQITLENVDVSQWSLSGHSNHDILQSLIDQHNLIVK
ncbi:retention module-containing protein [Aeromonas schubertii]|uniref:retention module-containing protein n=1 Tax=Aeromonas schubertii TaxID=652 RepID=UPI0010A8E572|nr:retention module-containing protein [Aeromonas schubertii]QCG48532.1 retention module-containing protein [Aeromonas schubertii]